MKLNRNTYSDLNRKPSKRTVENEILKQHVVLPIITYLTRQFDNNGEELSGGQWQKIAVARTFYRYAIFYILDEPSSSLDAESEDELFKQFEIMYKNKGALLVSHRLSNIQTADYIIALDNTKIIEEGTHEELLAKQGKYYNMYSLQASKYKMVT